jgi:hypothetical protein
VMEQGRPWKLWLARGFLNLALMRSWQDLRPQWRQA